MHVPSAKLSHSVDRNGNRQAHAQLVARKANKLCHKCGVYGHWQNEHLPNGSLPENTISSDTPVDLMNATMPKRNYNKTNSDKISKKPSSLQFNMASIDEIGSDSAFGFMVDNGTPYSAIRYDEIFKPAPKIKPDCIGELYDVSDEFLDCPYWQ